AHPPAAGHFTDDDPDRTASLERTPARLSERCRQAVHRAAQAYSSKDLRQAERARTGERRKQDGTDEELQQAGAVHPDHSLLRGREGVSLIVSGAGKPQPGGTQLQGSASCGVKSATAAPSARNGPNGMAVLRAARRQCTATAAGPSVRRTRRAACRPSWLRSTARPATGPTTDAMSSTAGMACQPRNAPTMASSFASPRPSPSMPVARS